MKANSAQIPGARREEQVRLLHHGSLRPALEDDLRFGRRVSGVWDANRNLKFPLTGAVRAIPNRQHMVTITIALAVLTSS